MSVLLNGIQPKAFYHGETPVKAIYRGNDLVWKKSRLPDGYQEVEWIESHGTEYINSESVTTVYSVLNVHFYFNNTPINPYDCIIGSELANYQSDRIVIRFQSDGLVVYRRKQGALVLCPMRSLPSNFDYNVTIDNINRIATFNESKIDMEAWASSIAPYYIFTLYYKTSAEPTSYSAVRLYSLDQSESGILVRQYVPCYRISDGEIGLYDLCGSICSLTNTPFYTNSGTGTFTKGADVN